MRQNRMLRTIYSTIGLLAIISMIIPLMNFYANAQFDPRTGLPLTTTQTQTQATSTPGTEPATGAMIQQVPVVSATDKDGGQHIVPLKATFYVPTGTVTNLPDFNLTAQNMVPLEKNGQLVLTLTPPQGTITSVTATTMDGLESAELEKTTTSTATATTIPTSTTVPTTENTWSLEKLSELPAGDEFIATIKTDLGPGSGTELVSETVLVFGGTGTASSDSDYYGETIDAYTGGGGSGGGTKITIKVTTGAPGAPDPKFGPSAPLTPDKDGNCPPPSKKEGDKCIVPPPVNGKCTTPSVLQGDKCVIPPKDPTGAGINPRGDPAKPFPPDKDGKCPRGAVLGESQPPVCMFPAGTNVFPPSAIPFIDITPNNDIQFLVPGKSPVVLCPSVPIPGTAGSGGPFNTNPPLRLSSCTFVSLPNGGFALVPGMIFQSAPVSQPLCSPGQKFVNGACEKMNIDTKTDEEECEEKDRMKWDPEDKECKKIQCDDDERWDGNDNRCENKPQEKKQKPDVDVDCPDGYEEDDGECKPKNGGGNGGNGGSNGGPILAG